MSQCLLAVANEDQVHLICPDLYRKDINKQTKEIFEEAEKSYSLDVAANDKKEQFCKWVFNLNQGSKQKKKSKDNDDEDRKEEESQHHPHILASIVFKTIISRLSWHAKADFLATMAHNI